MSTKKTSLKISLSPRDARIAEHMLSHQVRFWQSLVDEILLVLDLHGYDSEKDQGNIKTIKKIVSSLSSQSPKINLLEVDYSPESRRTISQAYFGGRSIPLKTHRYGPFYSYFYGIYYTKYDYVLSIDSDIFFGGYNPSWVEEAISLLDKKDVITCSPHPGRPRDDGKLVRQSGEIDQSPLRKVTFETMSTRIFFIHKPTFTKKLCPLPVRIAKWSLVWRALIRNRPIYELPEDTISHLMTINGLKRIDFLGTHTGIWSIHPPYRNEEFYSKLPEIVKKIEDDKLPEEQKGDYDLNSSMVDWTDAKEEIKQASFKRKILQLLGLAAKN